MSASQWGGSGGSVGQRLSGMRRCGPHGRPLGKGFVDYRLLCAGPPQNPLDTGWTMGPQGKRKIGANMVSVSMPLGTTHEWICDPGRAVGKAQIGAGTVFNCKIGRFRTKHIVAKGLHLGNVAHDKTQQVDYMDRLIR
ncbi:MAG: hypothetical protein R3E79_54040 [Caldilineaceae bacterium]